MQGAPAQRCCLLHSSTLHERPLPPDHPPCLAGAYSGPSPASPPRGAPSQVRALPTSLVRLVSLEVKASVQCMCCRGAQGHGRGPAGLHREAVA